MRPTMLSLIAEEVADPAVNVFAEVAAKLDFEALLRRLPRYERRVVYLSYQWGLRQREIAEVLGISVGEVCRILQLARTRLELSADGSHGEVA